MRRKKGDVWTVARFVRENANLDCEHPSDEARRLKDLAISQGVEHLRVSHNVVVQALLTERRNRREQEEQGTNWQLLQLERRVRIFLKRASRDMRNLRGSIKQLRRVAVDIRELRSSLPR